MRSIMHKKDGTCYLCMRLNDDYSTKATEEHHAVFGNANRRLSEKYGLKVYLCLAHHREGKEAVHKNYKNARYLAQQAQLAFEDRHPRLSFREIFGMNFVYERPKNVDSTQCEDGFRFIEET